MDRLKQEWKEIRIPEDVRLRARNLAWAKINRSSAVGYRLAWAAAASVCVILSISVWIWGPRETRVPARQDVAMSMATKAQDGGLQAETLVEPRIKPFTQIPLRAAKRSARRAKVPGASAREPERVVLNFVLPKTGAQMIWIMDSSFQFDGGVK